jgi:hypothetical protein
MSRKLVETSSFGITALNDAKLSERRAPMIKRGSQDASRHIEHVVAQPDECRSWPELLHGAAILALYVALVLGIAFAVFSETPAGTAEMSSHAMFTEYGPACGPGFEQRQGKCVAIRVPQHAFLDPIGDAWECQRGFQREGQACTVIKVPANAHLSYLSFGKGWECDPGYCGSGDVCTPLIPAPNACPYYDSYVRQWNCKRGYQVPEQSCAPVKVRVHAVSR